MVILENSTLKVKLLPELGGKIVSFYCKDKEFELAAETEKNYSMTLPDKADFSGYAFGMDEAFPNINEEEVIWKGRRLYYPDHGEIWSHPFRILEQRPLFVRLSWQSDQFSYYYEKQLSLEKDMLRIQYKIINMSGEELPCIWTWHGLMRYEQDMKIILPEGIKNCRNVLTGSLLGEAGHIYPIRNPVYDFSKVPEAATGSMIKYYGEEEVKNGYCGFVYPSQGIRCIMQYDPQKLPYFGVWITAGGFHGDHNCAMEPSSGFYDSISKAKALNRLQVLSAGEKLEFELLIALG